MMGLSYNDIITIIFGVVVLVFFSIYMLFQKRAKKNGGTSSLKDKTSSSPVQSQTSTKNSTTVNYTKDDVFNFMEFDRILDNMIIQNKGDKYTAVVKCKGINYNLMSEVEQLAVEEGFMTFLNTLKFPIQLYVQAQAVNLKSNIADYKENMSSIFEEYDDVNMEYNMTLNSLESTDEDIQQIEDKRNSILNVLEYGQDIIRYVEKMALNKSMLQRSFYILVSYYKQELSNASSFKNEELLDICYSELFTRVQTIRSGLTMCSVDTEILNSNEIAELIYSAYNRDDKNLMSVKQALEAGFHRLYSTSEDAVTKKHKKLIQNIKQEAEYKAIVALNQAIEEGTFTTEADAEDAYDQESSKQAIEIIKKEKLPDNIKQEAKRIIVDEYKKAKKERIEKQEEQIEKIKERLSKLQIEDEQEIIQQEKIVEQQGAETDNNTVE